MTEKELKKLEKNLREEAKVLKKEELMEKYQQIAGTIAFATSRSLHDVSPETALRHNVLWDEIMKRLQIAEEVMD